MRGPECGFRWTTGSGAEDALDTGIHVCIKQPSHVTDMPAVDHKCCCGLSRWSNDDD